MKISIFNKIIATVFFIGYCPVAPGTVASAFAMVILLIFAPSDTVILFILITSLILGTVASEKVAKESNSKDPSYVVIDEFAGYLTAVVFLPLNWQILVAGFVLFRFFDILKPPPIRQTQKIAGGLGIMLDDFLSGVISNLLIRVFLLL
ncbi:Phosphatidylglycerophosphatase A [Thermodesulfovibrio sp. N1]|uniref:phosphatidylglycerophosphatase A family protein n=1 Tax=Thermodesulfovibrio sp. N1 TaxID=1871110 RepID=UPI00083BA26E|nr:phosphatidylglycerophosphatase A [Thermodesulfovibrio sp. N1]ODA44944.1 Phosphatidylglycerophosphatase A [Thermodesulfovibrio sp. N1]